MGTHIRALETEHLPHTRGDEPAIGADLDFTFIICPTRVGMNRDPISMFVFPPETSAPHAWG